MCERQRQGRAAHPAGIGERSASGRPLGPAGDQVAAPAPPPTGVDRFVQSDGSITQAGRTTAEELIRLHGQLDPAQLNPVERLKAEAQLRVLRYLNIPSEQFAEAQEIVGMTTAALGGNPLQAIKVAVSMFMAGVRAMQAGQRVRDSVCAAHTFGYWVFGYRGLDAPSRPPAALHQSDVRQDNLHDDGVSAREWATRWHRCHRETLNRLDQSRSIGLVRNELYRHAPGMDLQGMTDGEILHLYKVMILSAEFAQDPRYAASVFFLKIVQALSRIEREVATRLYRRYPYPPPI